MSTATPAPTPESPAHRFAQVFAEGWRGPSYDSFVARFLPWIHADVQGTLPLMPVARGHEGFRDQFRRVFTLFPDLRATVRRATVDGPLLVIDAELTATLGGRPFTWAARDRFTFEGDRVKARVTSFRVLPLLFAIATRPGAWGRWWRSGVGPPLRRVLPDRAPTTR